MKYIVLTLSILFASTEQFAQEIEYTQELAERDINKIPQCKDQNSDICKAIKEHIKEFLEEVKRANKSGAYYEQDLLKVVADELSEEFFPSEFDKEMHTLLNTNGKDNIAPLITGYLRSCAKTKVPPHFTIFFAEVLAQKPSQQIFKFHSERVISKFLEEEKKQKNT